jgi:O-antigen ligase
MTRRTWFRRQRGVIGGASLFLFATLLAGCENNAQTGALTGAAVGGAVDGRRGAFVGGVTGYMIGNEMDKREAACRDH